MGIKVKVEFNIDLPLLKQQKDIFIRMIQAWGEADDEDQRTEAAEVEGLLYLLDEVQDECEKTIEDDE
jgi:hypothetical protein